MANLSGSTGRSLIEALGLNASSAEIISGNNIRVGYDFSSEDQLDDFYRVGNAGAALDSENGHVTITNGTGSIDALRWNHQMKASRILANVRSISGRNDYINIYTDILSSWEGEPWNPAQGLGTIIHIDQGSYYTHNGTSTQVTSPSAFIRTNQDGTVEFLISDTGLSVSYVDDVIDASSSWARDVSGARSVNGYVAFGAYETNTRWYSIQFEGEVDSLPELGIGSTVTGTLIEAEISESSDISGATSANSVVEGVLKGIGHVSTLSDGAELIENSTFEDNSWWNVSSDMASIADGVAHFYGEGEGSGILRQDVHIVGRRYNVSFEIRNYVSGFAYTEHYDNVVPVNSNGIHKGVYRANNTFFSIAGSAANFDIDNVHVNEVQYLCNSNSVLTGTLSYLISFVGGGVSTSSTVAAIIRASGRLSGGSITNSVVTGTTASRGGLLGTTVSSSILAATLRAAGTLAGVSITSSICAAPITFIANNILNGSVISTSVVSGTLQLNAYGIGTSTTLTSVVANLKGRGVISGTTSGSSDFNGVINFINTQYLTGTSPGTSVLSGLLKASLKLEGSSNGNSILVISLKGTTIIQGNILSSTSIHGFCERIRNGTGDLLGLSQVQGTMSGTTRIIGRSRCNSKTHTTIKGDALVIGISECLSKTSGFVKDKPIFWESTPELEVEYNRFYKKISFTKYLTSPVKFETEDLLKIIQDKNKKIPDGFDFIEFTFPVPSDLISVKTVKYYVLEITLDTLSVKQSVYGRHHKEVSFWRCVDIDQLIGEIPRKLGFEVDRKIKFSNNSGCWPKSILPGQDNGGDEEDDDVVVLTASISNNGLEDDGDYYMCRNSESHVVFTASGGTAPYTFNYRINQGSEQSITTENGNSINLLCTETEGAFTYSLISVVDANANQGIVTGSTIVNILPLPIGWISGGTRTVTQGDPELNVQFNGAYGTAPYTFAYQINGGEILNVTTESGTRVSVYAPTDVLGSFQYSLVSVRDSSIGSCTQPQTSTATVNVELPLLTASVVRDTDSYMDSEGILSIGPDPVLTFTGGMGVAPYTFTYNINGGEDLTITTETGNSVDIDFPVETIGSFVFTVTRVSDATAHFTNLTGVSRVVTIHDYPTATITNHNGISEVCRNTASPSIRFTGFGGPRQYTFRYRVNGGGIQSVTTAGADTIHIPIPTGTPGTYTYTLVDVTSGLGATRVQGGSAACVIHPSPTCTISAEGSINHTVTVNQNDPYPVITFTGNNGNPIYRFRYQINGGTVLDAYSPEDSNIATITCPTEVTGTFQYSLVSVVNMNTGCTQTQTGSVFIIVE